MAFVMRGSRFESGQWLFKTLVNARGFSLSKKGEVRIVILKPLITFPSLSKQPTSGIWTVNFVMAFDRLWLFFRNVSFTL